MRKLGIIAAIVVGLIVVVIVVIPLVVDINHYHGLVQSQLEKALGRSVTFGAMHLSTTPPSVRLDDLVIGEDPRFGGSTPFASAHSVNVSLKLWPLLRGNVDVQSLTLDQPHVQLVRNAAGVWNFSSIGSNKGQPQAGGQGGQFVLGKLAINDGQVTIVDQKANTRSVYNDIDLSLNGFAPGKAFDIDAAVHLPGAGNEALKLSGTAGPIADTMINTPFDGKLEFNQVSLGSLQKLSGAAALQGMDGTLTGTLNARNKQGTLASDGSLKLTDGVIHSAHLDYPITLDYKATDQLQSDQIHIDSAKLHLGQTPVVIDGDINGGATPAQVAVHLTLKEASIEEVARLASSFGVAFDPGMKVSGGITADVHATGAATSPAMNGSIVGHDVRVSGGSLKQSVDVGALSLSLTPTEIRSAPFTATSGGTKVAVQFTLANYTSPAPAIDATVRTANAKLEEVLSIARAYGVTAAQDLNGTGDINLDLHASGPMKNVSALNLSGSGKIANAALRTPDLAQPLGVKNADLRFTANSMTLENLAASLGSTHATGSVTVQNFAAPRVQFTLNADKLNVAEMQKITSAQPARQAWNVSLVPAANAAAAPPGIVDKMTGGGSLTIGTVEYDQLILQNLKATVALDHGVVRMSPVTASVYGGQESGSITVDLRQTPMAVSINSKLDQVDANKLISSVSSMDNTLYGLLAANGNTSFRAASSKEMARSLNGTLNLDLTKGRLAHVDLLNQLSNIAHFVGSAPGVSGSQPFTDILRLTGTFNVVNGLAQTNNLKALIPGGSLAADGSVNLADQGLNMHVTAVLEKALSQQVGGTQVGGFMNTALANAQGELVIPVLVTGTMNNPRFAPDVQKIAQMKIQQMLPTAANPGNAVSGILGAVLGNKQQGQQQQGGLGGILGALGGQQKQPAQSNRPIANPQNPPQAQKQQQPQNPLGNLLNQVLQQQQKKKPDQQQKPPPK